MPTVVIKVIN